MDAVAGGNSCAVVHMMLFSAQLRSASTLGSDDLQVGNPGSAVASPVVLTLVSLLGLC